MSEVKIDKKYIGITGDRNYNNSDVITNTFVYIQSILPNDKYNVIHGDCEGADKMAGKIASTYGYSVTSKPADWKKFGDAAGPIRNKEMLSLLPSVILIFHDNLKQSKGTANYLKLALSMITETYKPIFMINGIYLTAECLKKLL
jgi:hypothetical protein